MRCPYCNRWGFKFILKLNEHNMCRFCKRLKIRHSNYTINSIKNNCTKINMTLDVNEVQGLIITLNKLIENFKINFLNKGFKINFDLKKLSNSIIFLNDMITNQEDYLLKRLNLIKERKKVINFFENKKRIIPLLEEIHRTYLFLINYYYKMRKISEFNVEKTIEYCIKDIQLIESNLNKMRKIIQDSYNVRSFTQLIIIYTNRQQYDKALEICDKALKYKIPQTKVKYGYYGRKIKILKLKEKNLQVLL
ncbi:hypothetical protein KHQ81_00740 [Mycoplasmatota bacterium]|nr:hypothetical protein KHQ81_00740 [Mycoplasmatota bacterium]